MWKQNFVKRLCIIFNVGKDKLNESYLADEVRGGSHWSCLLIDIFLGKLIYSDSSAWDIPNDVMSKIQFLLDSITNIYELEQNHFSTIETAHKPNRSSRKSVVHVCNSSCIRHFPYQGPNKNICGVACFFSAILMTQQSVVTSIYTDRMLPTNLKWMVQIHNFSLFSRCIMIKWYVEGAINIEDIGLQVEVCMKNVQIIFHQFFEKYYFDLRC